MGRTSDYYASFTPTKQYPASAAVCRALKTVEDERGVAAGEVTVTIDAESAWNGSSNTQVQVAASELPRLLELLHADPSVTKTTHRGYGEITWERAR